MGYFKQAMIEDLAEKEYEYRRAQLLDRIDLLKERLAMITSRMPEDARLKEYWECLNSRMHSCEICYALPEEDWRIDDILSGRHSGERLWTAEDLIVGIRQSEDELKELVRLYEEENRRIAYRDIIPGQMNLMDFPSFDIGRRWA